MRGLGLTESRSGITGATETAVHEDLSEDALYLDNFEVFFCYFNISEIRMSHTIDVLI